MEIEFCERQLQLRSVRQQIPQNWQHSPHVRPLPAKLITDSEIQNSLRDILRRCNQSAVSMMVECLLEIAPMLFYLTSDICVFEAVEPKGREPVYQHYRDYRKDKPITIVALDTNNAPEISLPLGADQEIPQSPLMDFVVPGHPLSRS